MIHSSAGEAVVSVRELLHGILNGLKIDASVKAIRTPRKSVQRRMNTTAHVRRKILIQNK